VVRALVAAAAIAAACVAPRRQSEVPTRACGQVGRAQFLQAVPEASGLAYAGGVLWTHNDSDAPVLYRIDRSGRPAAVTVAGADVRDWEDLAAGPCPGAPASANATARHACLYIADIGDNQELRDRITIYQVPVPASASTSTARATAIHVRYPDGPHDAEALLIVPRTAQRAAQLKLSPTEELSPTDTLGFIITKEVPARVYRIPAPGKPGQAVTLAFLQTLTENARITGGAVSPDERWVALRSNRMLFLYTLDAFVNGGEPATISLRPFKEPQGEGVTFGPDADLFLVSEGGGKNAAGMLMRIQCGFMR
jgi:hypothetical protein